MHNGLETLSYLGPQIWAIVPDEMKNVDNLSIFKKKIRGWKPIKCPCYVRRMSRGWDISLFFFSFLGLFYDFILLAFVFY